MGQFTGRKVDRVGNSWLVPLELAESYCVNALREGERTRRRNQHAVDGSWHGKIVLRRSVTRLNYQSPWLTRSIVTISDDGCQNRNGKEEEIFRSWPPLPA